MRQTQRGGRSTGHLAMSLQNYQGHEKQVKTEKWFQAREDEAGMTTKCRAGPWVGSSRRRGHGSDPLTSLHT